MRWFRFDPFQHFTREQLTIGALRARASAVGVDISPKSSGGARPVAEGETRPVTSGDLMRMFSKHGNEEFSERIVAADA